MPWRNEIVGWMNYTDLTYIESLAKRVPKDGIIVEIGSFLGRSSVCWAPSADSSVKVYCIDLFNTVKMYDHGASEIECIEYSYPLPNKIYNIKEEFIKNTNNIPNIIMMQGKSPDDIVWNHNEIDILFIDAEHSNPNDWDNIKFFSPFIKPGGIISGHDYNNEFLNILENVKKLEQLTGNKVQLNGNIWTIQTDKKLYYDMFL